MTQHSVSAEMRALVGESPAMQDVRRRVVDYGRAEATVLIAGETGTGKELVARALHAASPRAGGPFVAVNCAALPCELVESELFGSTRGAFTGASSTRPGLFDAARGGTLLLDEIGEIPCAVQAKLLRVLETGGYRALGALAEMKSEARVLAASNRDLAELCERGGFRPDLYYRVAVLRIEIPPLRARRSDIPELVHHFAARLRGAEPPFAVAPEALAQLLAHPWPGNVRELRSAVERTLLHAPAQPIASFELEPARVPPDAARMPACARRAEPDETLRVLALHQGRLGASAAALGVSTRTLQRRLRAYGLALRDFRRPEARFGRLRP